MKKNKFSVSLCNDVSKLNHNEFNFIENILIFCPLKQRKTERESKVNFLISNKLRDKDICLIYWIDNKKLITDNAKKPDYLVIYYDNKLEKYIFTVVEFKGEDGKNQIDSITQINSFFKKLHYEIDKCFMGKLNNLITIQGILLTPSLTDNANKKIIRYNNSNSNKIFPIPFNKKCVDFYEIVSKKLTNDNFRTPKDNSRNFQNNFNNIENILKSLHSAKLTDNFKNSNNTVIDEQIFITHKFNKKEICSIFLDFYNNIFTIGYSSEKLKNEIFKFLSLNIKTIKFNLEHFNNN